MTRNAVEVVTDDEPALLVKSKKWVYAGYEPSGEIHLGHLVTVNKLIDLKEAGFEVVILLADLHAFLNRKGTMGVSWASLPSTTGGALKALVSVISNMCSDLSCSLPDYQLMVLEALSADHSLNRAKRSMDEVGRNMDAPDRPRMIYPIMQMVDIAQLDVDAAWGSIKGRSICWHVSTLSISDTRPRYVSILPSSTDFDGKKMSSSSGNYISASDSVEEIEKKCQKAFCPPNAKRIRYRRCSSIISSLVWVRS